MGCQHILIVEDDKNISRLVKYTFEKEGYRCHVTITAEDALEYLEKEYVDLIVLDIMLPKTDGLEACRQIKKDPDLSEIPIIMLTAKGEEIDRIIGFELGADDYVVKPFSPRELVLRVKAILKGRKPKEKTQNILKAGDLVVDIPKHKVSYKGKKINLTAMEFKLLATLIERKGRVQSRERLLEDVWDISADVTTRTVDTHIKHLRKKLSKAAKLIETVRGIGYCFRDEE